MHQEARPLDVGEELVAEPRASAAPSISPGMSATTTGGGVVGSIVPSTGSRVVKG